VIILYSNRTGRPPPIPTVWPRQQPQPPPLQLPAIDIPSSSTPPLFYFQAQPGGFETGAEDQLAWDEFRVDDVPATMEGTPQQVELVGPRQASGYQIESGLGWTKNHALGRDAGSRALGTSIMLQWQSRFLQSRASLLMFT
jgi:hypothetical protein